MCCQAYFGVISILQEVKIGASQLSQIQILLCWLFITEGRAAKLRYVADRCSNKEIRAAKSAAIYCDIQKGSSIQILFHVLIQLASFGMFSGVKLF